MTKSTITREQLEEWVAQFDEDGGCDATDRQLEALIRQSLAAMDSKPAAPVAEVVSIYGDPEAFGEREIRPLVGIQQMPYGTKLYRHAQPSIVPDAIPVSRDIDAGYLSGWNDCRAAMLAAAPQPQNAPQNIPEIIPDCWCRTCRPVVLNDMRFVVCPDCGNKRCPRANDHRNACTGSNEPGQEGSAYPDIPREVK